MAVPTDTIWELEPHTAAKHQILKLYLQPWFRIMAQSNEPRLNYIDGFCGPGRYKKGEPGSPLVALSVATPVASELEKVTFLFTDEGNLIIARLAPDGYHELSRVHLLKPTSDLMKRKLAWVPPVYVNRCIFARNDEELICASLAAKP